MKGGFMPLNIGDAAPDFSGVDVLTGETHSLSDYNGKIVLLIFSGPSWCGPCIFEAPILQDLWEEFSGYNVQFLMVSCFDNESPQSYQNAVENFGFTFPALLNPNQTITGLYQVTGVPQLYVISKDQVICNLKGGAGPPADALYQHIHDMLINCGAEEKTSLKVDIGKWRAVMTILFGVTGDGGGFGYTPGGKPIPVGPWDPLRKMSAAKRDMYINLAIAELTD
jgi:peroxiredoxin